MFRATEMFVALMAVIKGLICGFFQAQMDTEGMASVTFARVGHNADGATEGPHLLLVRDADGMLCFALLWLALAFGPGPPLVKWAIIGLHLGVGGPLKACRPHS